MADYCCGLIKLVQVYPDLPQLESQEEKKNHVDEVLQQLYLSYSCTLNVTQLKMKRIWLESTKKIIAFRNT